MGLPSAEQLERVLVDAVDREPDSELIDRDDWVQVRTPSSVRPNHNHVLVARLDAGDLGARIAEVTGEHAARGASLRWVVGPSSTPADLGASLQAAGLVALGHSLGMALAVATEIPAPDVPGLTVSEVGPEDIDLYAEVTARAWGRGPELAEALRYIVAKAFNGVRRTWSWIASIDGEPVATSHLRVLGPIGYFQGCAVVPEQRGRGIYRALLHHRLAVLRERGIPVAVVWANAAGAGTVCTKLGFTTVTTADFFTWDPPRGSKSSG